MAENLGMNQGLFDRTVRILTRTLDYRAANQRVISTNIANMDTPGFRPKELKFGEALQQAVDNRDLHLLETNRKHLPGFSESGIQEGSSFVLETEPANPVGDHSLNIDMEMAKMAKNNLLYQATVKMLSNKFDLLKTAIEGGK